MGTSGGTLVDTLRSPSMYFAIGSVVVVEFARWWLYVKIGPRELFVGRGLSTFN